MMKKVSIIVPVYNVSEYIEKCVESILSQTYKNIEVILVDDGSPDDCPQICDDIATKDGRVKVVHKKNGGLSSARNSGIEIATGDYIAFVDSDDYVFNDYIETLVNACIENDCKISACGYFEYYSENYCKTVCGASSYTISPEEAIKDIFTMKNEICVVAWNKLYAADLFMQHNIRYPEGKIHEDVFTTYKLCALSNKIVYVNKPLYYYVQRSGSIMGQSFSEKRLQLIDAVKSIEPFVEQRSPEFDKEFQYYVFLNYLTLLNTMADCNYKDKKLFCELRAKIFEMYSELRVNEYFGKKNKLTCFFLKFGLTMFYLIRKIYKRI